MNQVIYTCQDANQNELFKKIRINQLDKSKSFYFEQINENTTIKNLDEVEPVLYRLHSLLEGIKQNETIFLVKGEKDVGSVNQFSK